MSSAIKVLSAVQVGVESVKGTGVAATRRLVCDARYRRQQEIFEFTDMNAGVFARVPRAPVRTREGTEVELRCPLDFQQILLPLESGMEGGVTPTGAGADKTWTFDPSTTAPPTLNSYTVEFTEASPDDTAEMEFTWGITREFEITATDGGMPELRWTMFGRATTDSTMTGALTVPTLEYSPNPRWAVYVDTTMAGIGSTQVSAQVYGFRYRYTNGVNPGYYLDGRSSLDFTQEEVGTPMAELEMDIVHDPDAAAFVQTHEALKTAGTLRFIELRLTGASLGGSNYSIKLQGCYGHAQDSMEERGNDRDGNLTVRAHFLSAYDVTSALQSRIIVVNNLTAFPA